LFNLRSVIGYRKIGVWGKSMGAVTAIYLASKTTLIDAMILDSPFDKLKNVVLNLMQ